MTRQCGVSRVLIQCRRSASFFVTLRIQPVDVVTHHHVAPILLFGLVEVSLKPSDGIIHSWLNRMLLPYHPGRGEFAHAVFLSVFPFLREVGWWRLRRVCATLGHARCLGAF
jgi:aconitase B